MHVRTADSAPKAAVTRIASMQSCPCSMYAACIMQHFGALFNLIWGQSIGFWLTSPTMSIRWWIIYFCLIGVLISRMAHMYCRAFSKLSNKRTKIGVTAVMSIGLTKCRQQIHNCCQDIMVLQLFSCSLLAVLRKLTLVQKSTIWVQKDHQTGPSNRP